MGYLLPTVINSVPFSLFCYFHSITHREAADDSKTREFAMPPQAGLSKGEQQKAAEMTMSELPEF